MRFYRAREGYTVWHGDGQLNRRGKWLLSWIDKAGIEGLSPENYHQAILLRADTEHQLRELLLTDAFFLLVRDLSSGRYKAEDWDTLWYYEDQGVDPVQFLEMAIVDGNLSDDLLQQLLPNSPDYQRLKAALSAYRKLAEEGGWPKVNLQRYKLRPGMRDPGVSTLRKRLELASDSLADENNRDLYDPELVSAVRNFQLRHGLVMDGVVGPLTLAAMNTPVDYRIGQILLNLERWRWLPRDMGEQYLQVNVAGFQMKLVDRGNVVLQQRTISGKRERQTPSFRDRITHLVVNPQWTVPRIIAVEDMLPRQQLDQSFLDSRQMQVF
jgi:murein L,D-transpeptidase YcbB/YkuD